MSSEYIELAKSASAHGIKGGVTLKLYNTFEDSILESGMKVLLLPATQDSELPIEGSEEIIEKIQFGNKAILYLKGVQDRNQIEKYLPFTLSVDRNLFPSLDEDEFYLADLVGSEVFNQKGKFVGKVSSIIDHGAGDIIVIDLNNGDQLSLPINGPFFESIDIETKKVVIKDVEYL